MTERLVVLVRVTEHCNLACSFCKYDRTQPIPRRTANPERLLALGEALARATAPVHVSWIGGEPLTWAPLGELTRIFRRHFGLSMGVTTNGTALTSASMREHVLLEYDELTVSVDGLGATHDRLRGWPGGFEHLRSSVCRIGAEKRQRAGGPLLRANVVLMRDNLHQLVPLCHELASWGIEEVTFNQLGGNDRPEFHREHHLLPEQVARLAEDLPRWQRELRKRGLALRGSQAYVDRILATTNGVRLKMEDCSGGERFLFVDEGGVAAPCSFTLRDYGVRSDDIAVLPARFGEARRLRRAAACGDCHSTQLCGKFAS